MNYAGHMTANRKEEELKKDEKIVFLLVKM